jgi:site-specific DNA-methyltransferase (adenine-specific)
VRPVIEIAGARVFQGDCREVLKGLPDNSVDSIVTDPPYELGFMGKKWDSSGIAYDVTVWQECLRVLKPGGHLLAFGGSRTYHRLGVAIEDAGFEIRDTIAWISSKTFPKSLNVSKAIDKKLGAEREVVGKDIAGNGLGLLDRNSTIGGAFDLTVAATSQAKTWEGWGTGLKQVVEPVVMARKPLEGTVAENTLAWGVGGINIDASRVAGDMTEFVSATGKPRSGMGHGHGFGMGEGFGGENANPPHAQGRWPANVILDEVSAGLLDEQSGVSSSQPSNRGNINTGQFGGYAENERRLAQDTGTIRGHNDSGGASRFFYVAKASKRDRNEGLEELEEIESRRYGDRNAGNLPQQTPQGAVTSKNFHPTVKPTALMRYLIKLVTPPGGTVLDPFTGSGSTGKAALLDGFQFVGIELTEEYLPIIEGRLKWANERVDEDDTLF